MRWGRSPDFLGLTPPSVQWPQFLQDPCLDRTCPATGASPDPSLRRCTYTRLLPTPSFFGLTVPGHGPPPSGRPPGVPGQSLNLPQSGRHPEGPLRGLTGLMGH